MNDKVRIQVLDNSTEHEWKDVGNKAGDESVPVNISSVPLPSGASTSAKQDTQITEAQSTNTKLDTLNAKDFATSAKQDTGNTSLSSAVSNLQTLNSLVPTVYDYISLSYTGSNLTGVVFKSGGSGGTTVSTLTLAYSGSTLTSVTKT